MKSRMIPKFILDIILTVIFLMLIDPKNTGFTFHEMAGLSLGVLFGFHILLNWSWVKGIAKNLANPKLKSRPKWLFVIDMVSFLSVLTILVTGVGISQVLFAGVGTGVGHSWVIVHKWVSYFCLALFSVHIALHWRFILEAGRRLFTAWKVPHPGQATVRLGATVLIVGWLSTQLLSSAGNGQNMVTSTAASEPVRSSELEVQPSSGVTQTESSQNSTLSPSSTGDTGDIPSLNDYLGSLFCTGCEKHCSLLNLGCDKGTRQAQAAQIEYQQIYSTN